MNSTRLLRSQIIAIAALLVAILFSQTATVSADDSLQAIHAGKEPKNCLDSDCHAAIASGQTLDADIEDAHVVMLAEAPGKGHWQCVWCHRSVDLTQAAGLPLDEKANLRKRVDVKICVICHGRDPAPGMPLAKHKQFYQVTQDELDPPPDGAELYDLTCSGCHRPLQDSKVSGKSESDIQKAIDKNKGEMGPLSALNSEQIADIADALGSESNDDEADDD